MTNDRTTQQPTHSDLPDGSLGDDLRSFLGDPPPNPKPKRNTGPRIGRQLRATFSTHGPDRRPAGGSLQPAAARPDGTPAGSPRSDDSARRRSPLLEARGDAGALRPAQPTAEGGAGGRVRGRRGRPPKQAKAGGGSGSRRGVEAATRPIDQAIPVGVRATITDPVHPWHTFAGEIVSGPEKFGLGWVGQRIKLDGNHGEAFIRPEQTDWKRKPGRPRVIKVSALPAAIKKLVPKSDPAPASSSKLIPTETERSNATRLFREIGKTFNENRKKSKTAAYAAFRHDLMDNLDTLIMGGALDLKEATTIITNLEQYTRETEQESTETPATILGRWLRMDAAEVAGLTVSEEPVEESVEDEENSGEEIDEAEVTTGAVFSDSN